MLTVELLPPPVPGRRRGVTDMTECDFEDAAEWRIPIYVPVIKEMLTTVGHDYFLGKRLLEVGFGLGNFAIFLAKLGADVTAFEQREENRVTAMQRATAAGVGERCNFKVDDFFQLEEKFDGVVGKSVLYGIRDLETYDTWLAQFAKLLLPGGEAIIIENGTGNSLVKFYRHYLNKRKGYADNVLSNPAVLDIFEKHFEIVDLHPHYSLAQFVPVKPLINLDFKRKQAFRSCFVYWIRLRKRGQLAPSRSPYDSAIPVTVPD
jgi:SAM-dependent methyltransferase